MNAPEFNELLSGKDAMWAQFENMPKLENMLQLNSQLNAEQKQESREEIKQNEIPIPDHIQNQVNKFIAEQKAKGEKFRAIKRMVARKFNIYVQY